MKELAKKLLTVGGFGGAMYGMGHVHGSSRPKIGPNTELETIAETSAQTTLTLPDFFTVAFSAVVLALTVTLVGVALTVVPVTDL